MSILNIYLDRINHNLKFLKSLIPEKSELIAVVKSNAYGHGAVEIAEFLEKKNINRFAVASANEGKILREGGINSNIIVFYPDPSDLSQIIKYSLEPAIYSKQIWQNFTNELIKFNKSSFPVHIKFNTGLNRIGFNMNEIDWIIKNLVSSSFKINSVYSHLSSSEEEKNNPFTENQIELFEKIKIPFQNIDKNIKYHLLNSSGVFNYHDHNYDWFRVGISLYGYSNNKSWDNNLLPVAELNSKIIQIHKVKKDESVGYNSGWISKRTSLIATVAIGHADGIGRYFGNGKTYVTVNDKRVRIIGNICMDMLMLDVTEIDCKEGDKVILFDKINSATKFAESGDTISYELLSGLGQRVIRNYI